MARISIGNARTAAEALSSPESDTPLKARSSKSIVGNASATHSRPPGVALSSPKSGSDLGLALSVVAGPFYPQG